MAAHEKNDEDFIKIVFRFFADQADEPHKKFMLPALGEYFGDFRDKEMYPALVALVVADSCADRVLDNTPKAIAEAKREFGQQARYNLIKKKVLLEAYQSCAPLSESPWLEMK